jgi:radical SAM protein with 4Fe4S-binding SPASM domain
MDYGQRRGLRFGLVTNGYWVERLWEELKRFNYFLYFTSVDGLAEYHDTIRRKDSFRRAMKGLELFSKLNVPVRMVNTVVHPQNIKQLDGLLKQLKASPATLWRIAPLANKGRAVGKDAFFLNGGQLQALVEFVEENKKVMPIELAESHMYLSCFGGHPVGKPFFCGAGLTRCSVTPDGEVMGCHDVYDNRLSEGSIRDRPFSRIWKEEFARFREKKQIRDMCRGCEFMRACQGGCWAEMEKQHTCLKPVWERGD